MKKVLPVIILAVCAAAATPYFVNSSGPAAATDLAIEQAFVDRRSKLQVGATGTVTRMLSDDNDGARHQRFVLELESGHTVLIVHNIDLAPRIDELRRGDRVSFFGEYEWNEQGGVIHWTHHDPARRHIDGWLEYDGLRYE
jgi:hypothetical protein